MTYCKHKLLIKVRIPRNVKHQPTFHESTMYVYTATNMAASSHLPKFNSAAADDPVSACDSMMTTVDIGRIPLENREAMPTNSNTSHRSLFWFSNQP